MKRELLGCELVILLLAFILSTPGEAMDVAQPSPADEGPKGICALILASDVAHWAELHQSKDGWLYAAGRSGRFAISSDQKYLVAVLDSDDEKDKQFGVWDLNTNTMVGSQTMADQIVALTIQEISPTRHQVLVADKSGLARLYNVQEKGLELAKTFPVSEERIVAAAIVSGHSILGAGSTAYCFSNNPRGTEEELGSFVGTGRVTRIASTPDRTLLFAVGWDNGDTTLHTIPSIILRSAKVGVIRGDRQGIDRVEGLVFSDRDAGGLRVLAVGGNSLATAFGVKGKLTSPDIDFLGNIDGLNGPVRALHLRNSDEGESLVAGDINGGMAFVSDLGEGRVPVRAELPEAEGGFLFGVGHALDGHSVFALGRDASGKSFLRVLGSGELEPLVNVLDEDSAAGDFVTAFLAGEDPAAEDLAAEELPDEDEF